MEILTQYSGLFSLLAVIAAIIVPVFIYHKEKRDQRKDAQDELDAMEDNVRFPMSMDERRYYTRKSVLEKKSRRK